MLLTEHCVVLCWSSTLFGKQIHDFSDLLAQLCKSLHYIISVGELVEDLLDHISQLGHEPVLQIKEVLFVGLSRHLCVQLVQVSVCIISMSLKLSSKAIELVNTLVEQALISAAATSPQTLELLLYVTNCFSQARDLVFKSVYSSSEQIEILFAWELQSCQMILDLLNLSRKRCKILPVALDILLEVPDIILGLPEVFLEDEFTELTTDFLEHLSNPLKIFSLFRQFIYCTFERCRFITQRVPSINVSLGHFRTTWRRSPDLNRLTT